MGSTKVVRAFAKERTLDATERAARRAGMGLNEYVDRLDRGDLFCYRCQGFHPGAEFGSDRSRVGGKTGSCLRALRAARKSRRGTLPRGRRLLSLAGGAAGTARC
jgi:hypothetical protein